METLNALASAVDYHQAGNLPVAIELYRQILQAEPDNADALHLMGNAAGQLGDIDFSITLIARAAELFPANPVFLASLGLAYRHKKAYDAAIGCYQRILDSAPQTASAWLGIGNTQLAQGRPDDAAHSFARAIALDPRYVEARYSLANLQKSVGNMADAIDQYQIAVILQPDFADAHHNMGSALYALGQLDEALASYRLALPGNFPETFNNIGTIHFDRGEFDQALAHYRQALALQPDYAEARDNAARTSFSQGVAYFTHDDPGAAAACFEQAAFYRPDDVEALYNLGLIYHRLGHLAEAESRYRQVLALDPGYIDAHINLSGVLMDGGRESEARQHIALAYTRKNLFEKHVAGADKTVLILFDAGKGNLNLTHLFNPATCNTIDWMIEYATEGQAARLPCYDLVFNAMGDADLTGNTEGQVRHFLQLCKQPLLNHPDRVKHTARDQLPALLEGIAHLLVPQVWRIADAQAWTQWERAEQGDLAGRLPLLVRPVHTQGGIGMTLAATTADLALRRAQQAGPLYASAYVDFRSEDGYFRKYRMIFIDRKPYPYHLAISPQWMVHYYTAGMEDCAWKLEEEKRYLEQPEAVLGSAGMQALTEIGERLDLDYAGIDFSIMPDGRILVFEANPSMLVHPETAAPLLHKNVHVQHIFDAFEALLQRTAARSRDQAGTNLPRAG